MEESSRKKLDGHEEEDTGWKEVRRRNTKSYQRKKITSFFVTGFGDATSKDALWKAFSRFGLVVDVYIAKKKGKGGRNFAFIRFEGVKDPSEMEKSLEIVTCGEYKLQANVARYERKEAKTSGEPSMRNAPVPPVTNDPCLRPRNGISFADVVKGRKFSHSSVLSCSKTSASLSEVSLHGEAKSFQILKELPNLIDVEGATTSGKVRYAGGLTVVISFNSPEEATGFLNLTSLWNPWFNWLKLGFQENSRFERIAWLKMVGVPLTLRSDSNFSLIASNFGKVLEITEGEGDSFDLSRGVACILTASRRLINEEVNCVFRDISFSIGVMEVNADWHPFDSFPNSEDHSISDDEDLDVEREEGEIMESDEDGVSDTWINNVVFSPDAKRENRLSPENSPSIGKAGENEKPQMVVQEYVDPSNGAFNASINRNGGAEGTKASTDSPNLIPNHDGDGPAKCVGPLSDLEAHFYVDGKSTSSPHVNEVSPTGVSKPSSTKRICKKRRRNSSSGKKASSSVSASTSRFHMVSSNSLHQDTPEASLDVNKEAQAPDPLASPSHSSASATTEGVPGLCKFGAEIGFQFANLEKLVTEILEEANFGVGGSLVAP